MSNKTSKTSKMSKVAFARLINALVLAAGYAPRDFILSKELGAGNTGLLILDTTGLGNVANLLAALDMLNIAYTADHLDNPAKTSVFLYLNH